MKRFLSTPVLLALGAIALATATATAQQESTKNAFNWTGAVATGHWIRLVDLNGTITFGETAGNTVQVVATERWRRGDPSVVRFDVKKGGAAGADITVCALWGVNARCDESSSDEHDDNRLRNNDVSVDFKVLVPRGVKVGASSVNGTITLSGIAAEVRVATVNGTIDLASSGGPIDASTVNGEIKARVGRVDAAEPMAFHAVNGSITLDLPADLGADVELSTVNGSLKSDYEMTVSGRINARHMAAHIGKPGGPKISLATVNGDVQLRRG